MEKMDADHTTTLNQAREWLRARLRGGNAQCPACEQLAKVYKRPLNGAMALFLVRAYRYQGREWFHAPTFIREDRPTRNAIGVGGEHSKLKQWGLIEESKDRRDDGGRAGWWRITELGEKFALAQVSLMKYVLLYDGRQLSYEGPNITITEALGTKFDYRELMDN